MALPETIHDQDFLLTLDTSKLPLVVGLQHGVFRPALYPVSLHAASNAPGAPRVFLFKLNWRP